MKSSARLLRGLTVVCAAALMLLLTFSAEAQTFRGSILGTIMDSSGAAVSGASVTVKNLDTGLTRVVTTSDDGSYNVPELPIGNYSVSVEKTGFRTGVVSGIRVEVSAQVRADVTLQPGEISQKVEVLGESLPQVETTSNTLGGVVEASTVTNLPVNGRDYQKLIFLVPGVAGSPDQITDSPGSYGIFSMNGARGRSNNFLLDGTDMNDGYRNDPAINEAGVFGTPATILPVEAIAELRVLSNFEPEYGRSAGGVINTVTKSGTNQFHGSALEYFRNTVLNARNYFDDASVGPQQPFHNNQFGGSLGGPIVKDKTFFFADYEGTREKGAQSSPACVPTAADIATATANNGGLVNPVIANLLALNPWPAATNAAVDCYANGGTNAALSTPFSNRVDNVIAKIDHQLNANDLLTGRYYFGDSSQSFPLALVGGGLLPNYNTFTPTRVQLVSISYVKVINPSVVNEARLGWNRFAEGFFPQDRSFDPASINLNTGVGAYNFGLPKISVSSPSGSSLAPLGADNGDPRQRVDTNWHFIDNISWKRGGHDIKFGYEFRRTSISQMFNRGFRGTLNFDSLDSFIAGTPGSSSFQRQGNTNRNTSENSHAFYLQDSFRWRKNLTINYGVRYDYFGVIHEKHGNFTNVDPATGAGIILGGKDLYQPDYNNFSPRVSVAWDVSGKGKTVLRAGYGFFYDAFSQDMFMGHLPWNSVFDPGPAYAGFGPNLISQAGLFGGALSSTNPVYGASSPMSDAFGVDPNIRTPYMQNFNLNLQQELTKKMVLQIGYVGSNGHKLFRFRDINQPSQAQITAADLSCPNPTPPPATIGCINDWSVPRRFAATSPFFYINWQESSANSTYNSLQVSWKINDWHGLNSTVSYNWSHSLDDASDGEDYVPNAAQPNDSMAPIRMNRGNSNFDVRNHFTWNFLYTFPNRKGSWSRLTDGWGVNGIVTLQSGQPFHLNYNFQDDFDGSGGGFGRPDVVGTITYNRNDPRNFLDLTAFAIPCSYPGGVGDGTASTCTPGTRHFGNLGRNSLRGPDFRQFDFSIFKDTQITERVKVQFRAEAYNLFNHPNFANPYLPTFIADAAPNGIGTNGRSLGSLGLAATGDVGIGYPFLGSGGPRGIQLAVRFTF
ncbi:MAG: TonB-dependent receptor [Acidobacteriia bacterium]|nr:TonB-dependent receptor [Terriglobia bacterium]